MRLESFTRLLKGLAVAAAVVAVIAPAALARTDPYGSTQSYTPFVTDLRAPAGGTTFITDTLAPGGGPSAAVCSHVMPVSIVEADACWPNPTSLPVQSTPVRSTPNPVTANPVSGDGFNWDIVGYAGGGALALLLGIYAGLRFRAQRRHPLAV
ncbi:MAG TPA: hypothetical protein VFA56_02120 [Gaiellaceae bacterium]|nr:hypothetical protein [Gaiellaceae bacterium]